MQSTDQQQASFQEQQPSRTVNSGSQQSTEEILSLIEKLAQLEEAGALSDSEYTTTKSELLARL